MKRISRIAALLTASAFLFGFAACSDGDSDGNSNSGTPDNPETPSGGTLTAIPDSWNFVNQDSATWVTTLNANTSSSADGTRSLSSDIEIKGADEELTLTLCKEGGISDYKDKLGASGNSAPSYSYVDPALGLRIKGSAIKIAGVQGKVGVKIAWAGGGNRSLGIYKGSDDSSPVVKTVDTSKTTASATGNNGAITVYEQDDVDETFDFTSAKKDLYIVAGNNIYIKSIEISDKADAVEKSVTVKFPDMESGLSDETKITSTDYPIGYASSISADDLSAKLKADTTKAELMSTIINMAQSSVNETLTEGGAAEGAVTVTAEHVNFFYFATAEAWTAYDDAYSNGGNDSEIESAMANALSSIDGGATVYVSFGLSEALWSALDAAIANAGATWAAYDTITLTGTAVTSLETPNAIKYVKTEVTPSTDPKTYTYPCTAVSSITSDYTVLATDASVSGGSSHVSLTLSKYSGTGVGSSKVGSATMPTETTDENPASSSPSAIAFKADSTKGLMIKKDALKFTLPAGTYNVVVNFYQNSTSDRNLEVTFGDSGTTETKAAGTAKGDVSYEKELVTAESDMNVYIGASNELYIKSIVIKKAE